MYTNFITDEEICGNIWMSLKVTLLTHALLFVEVICLVTCTLTPHPIHAFISAEISCIKFHQCLTETHCVCASSKFVNPSAYSTEHEPTIL